MMSLSGARLTPPGIVDTVKNIVDDRRLLRQEVRRQREEREIVDRVVEAVVDVAERALTLGVTVSPKLLLDLIDRASEQ